MSAASALVLTALLNGGGTVWSSGDIVKNAEGYVVGGKVPTLVLNRKGQDASALHYVVRDWVDKNPSLSYGSWKDEETGLLHFDVVDFVDERDEAIELGQERGELAIWDFGKGEEIRL